MIFVNELVYETQNSDNALNDGAVECRFLVGVCCGNRAAVEALASAGHGSRVSGPHHRQLVMVLLSELIQLQTVT